MRLFAHIGPDGSIEGMVAGPEEEVTEGEVSARLVAGPGVEVCEVQNHGLTEESVKLDDLTTLLEANTVALTAASGKLVPRRD